jgi:Lrp/AsnC family leucine-responsive transcriptional regulator
MASSSSPTLQNGINNSSAKLLGKEMAKKLDRLDFKILHQLQKDGRTSITNLAEKVESSRPTVTNRLRLLLENEQIVIHGGLSLKATGYKVACVGLEVKNDESRKKMEKYLKDCPRVIYFFRTPEKANIHVGVWGEEDQTLNSTIESFRDHQDVDIVFTHYLGTPIHGDISIKVHPMKNDKTPCGVTCSQCHRYNNGWCLGCPASTDYKNPLLK